jgi:hypothetical protein
MIRKQKIQKFKDLVEKQTYGLDDDQKQKESARLMTCYGNGGFACSENQRLGKLYLDGKYVAPKKDKLGLVGLLKSTQSTLTPLQQFAKDNVSNQSAKALVVLVNKNLYAIFDNLINNERTNLLSQNYQGNLIFVRFYDSDPKFKDIQQNILVSMSYSNDLANQITEYVLNQKPMNLDVVKSDIKKQNEAKKSLIPEMIEMGKKQEQLKIEAKKSLIKDVIDIGKEQESKKVEKESLIKAMIEPDKSKAYNLGDNIDDAVNFDTIQIVDITDAEEYKKKVEDLLNISALKDKDIERLNVKLKEANIVIENLKKGLAEKHPDTTLVVLLNQLEKEYYSGKKYLIKKYVDAVVDQKQMTESGLRSLWEIITGNNFNPDNTARRAVKLFKFGDKISEEQKKIATIRKINEVLNVHTSKLQKAIPK